MAEQPDGADELILAAAARHALHDEELLAAFAAGAVDDPAEAERARGLVARCAVCRDLHADLRDLRSALQAEAKGVMAAPRDFRLSRATAERIRPGFGRVPWRVRLAGLLVSFGRPVGVSLATLGLAGLLVGTLGFTALAPSAGQAAASPGSIPGGAGGSEISGSGPAASDAGAAFGTRPSGDKALESAPAVPAATSPAPADGLRASLLILSAMAFAAGVAVVVVGFALRPRSAEGTDRRTASSG